LEAKKEQLEVPRNKSQENIKKKTQSQVKTQIRQKDLKARPRTNG